jgi:pimeloyl-ACP methyl ester carboxylesterase
MKYKTIGRYFDEMMMKRGLPPLHERFESDSVANDGLRLHLDVLPGGVRGAGTVVFVPGTSVYAMCYAEFMAAAGDAGFNVVGVDPRGHGRSEGARGSYTVPELVSDALAAVRFAKEKFGGRVAIAGSSQGGIVAFYAAAADGSLAGAVCHNFADLASPDSVRLTRVPPAQAKIVRAAIPAIAGLAPMAKMPIRFYLDLKREKMRGYGDIWNFIKKDPLALRSIRLRAMASLCSCPTAVPVENITVPILALQAEHDHIFPADYTRKHFDRLTCEKRLETFRGLPHLIMTEHVPEIMPAVAEWLRERFGEKA